MSVDASERVSIALRMRVWPNEVEMDYVETGIWCGENGE